MKNEPGEKREHEDDPGDGTGDGGSPDALLENAVSSDADPALLHLSPDEREARGVTDADVREAFLAVLAHGTADQKDLRGVTLPALALDRLTLEGVDRHPVDLRGATVEALSLEESRVAVPLLLDGATIGSLDLDRVHVETTVSCSEATVTGATSLFEARFDDRVSFDGAAFEGPVDGDEATFHNDVRFDDATFADEVTFRAAACHGDSNFLEDNTTFSGATFRARASFRETEFGFTRFDAVDFRATAVFQETTFTGDADFAGATFDALADFDEARFDGDAAFEDATFGGRADFRGAAFAGGARALVDDVSFAGATFQERADFRRASFRYGSFAGTAFRAVACFEEACFDADADFPDATFADEADFDEGRFREDADFSAVRFEGRATFRGCEFDGGANHLEDDATFADATFAADADFHDAWFSSVTFRGTAFGGAVDCRNCVVDERIDLEAHGIDSDAFVDFTGAKLRSGEIVQPAEGWVRYDLTLASVGDVDLAAERPTDRRQLLDYFRFCRTEFDEFDGHVFDFSGHREYLDRNDWTIHTFDEPRGAEPEYALEMTPEVVETTYLKAKQSAQDVGDTKVAGEFRIKRQRYARRKNLEVAADPSAGPLTRAKNAGRAAENVFLGVTCGHGIRPLRIGAAFVLAPLLFAIPYTFGGEAFAVKGDDLATAGGLEAFYGNLYFSYISYTTIGYGDLTPVGPLAQLLAGSQAFLSTILAALLVYALVKRSEL